MRFVAALLIVLGSHSAAADGIPLATCPTPETFAEIQDWIHTVDTQKLASKLDPPTGKDYQSKLGFIIRESCFKGTRSSESSRKEIIRHYERAVGYMLQQTSRCFKAFGLGSIASIPSLIRVAEFECEVNPGEQGAEAAVAVATGLYSVDHALAIRKLTVTVNIQEERDFQDGPAGLGRLLFHEMLHFTANNNRLWHADVLKMKDTDGCERKATLDRIYFIQTACFPATSAEFWGTASNLQKPLLETCKDVCERALSEVDDRKELLKQLGFRGGKYAEFLVAKPVQTEQRKLACDRLKGMTLAVHDYSKRLISLERKFDQELRRHLPADLQEEGKALFKLFKAPVPLPEGRRKVTAAIDALQPKVRDLCGKLRCGNAGVIPYEEFFKRARDLLDRVHPNQRDAFELVFSRPPE